MNFNEVVYRIDESLKFGIKPGLEKIQLLLDCLGNPEKDYKAIHVAGTNGKGSTVALTSSVLVEAGYKVGVFTSPHLKKITERFKINEVEISEKDFAIIGEKVLNVIDELAKSGHETPTHFEVLTAMGFLYFSMEKVDFAVIEVGLGGRLDSTNVLNPELCYITSISYDHTDVLGDTIEKIAVEKAGIIKKDCLIAVYPQSYKEAEEVIKKKILKERANSVFTSNDAGKIVKWDNKSQTFDFKDNGHVIDNLEIGLIGDHQVKNASNVLNGLLQLAKKFDNIDEESIRRGFKNVNWPCRLSVVPGKPLILADGAHNREGLQSLADALDKYFADKKKVLLIGMLKDKEYRFAAEIFASRFEYVITTEADSVRKLGAEEFAEVFREFCVSPERVLAEADWEKAVELTYQKAHDCKCDMICISGSLYITGYLLDLMKEKISDKKIERRDLLEQEN